MARSSSKNNTIRPLQIGSIAASGLKSIDSQQSIEVRPLTILAGPNSSGKSSIMQSVLLLKQTLEASYDPGPLLINGPNVKFSSIEQMMFRGLKARASDFFSVKVGFGSESIETTFDSQPVSGLEIRQFAYDTDGKQSIIVKPGMPDAEIIARASETIDSMKVTNIIGTELPKGSLVRERFFCVNLWN